jgi:hypothetical protein
MMMVHVIIDVKLMMMMMMMRVAMMPSCLVEVELVTTIYPNSNSTLRFYMSRIMSSSSSSSNRFFIVVFDDLKGKDVDVSHNFIHAVVGMRVFRELLLLVVTCVGRVLSQITSELEMGQTTPLWHCRPFK